MTKNYYKEQLEKVFNSLSEKVRNEILSYYEKISLAGIRVMAMELANRAYNWMERQGYGAGEMRYMFREAREEMEEEGFGDFGRAYANLAEAYFESKIEAKINKNYDKRGNY